MRHLELFSEPFAKTGNIAAEGFRRLLGRPALGLLETVIRESIQNSVDAARLRRSPRLLLRYRALSREQLSALRSRVFADLPAGDQTRREMEGSLHGPDCRVLEICDFGTVGLGGPTRGDAPTDAGEALDFVNFMRNVGAGRDNHQGGGTYGYGKTSLYAMSACSTILVDSATTWQGAPVRRLMACHLGNAFDANNGRQRRRYTGRHWWGKLDEEGGVDPLTGAKAEEISRLVGLPERRELETGTSIMILDPHLEGEEWDTVADQMVETVLWNFWPRMTETTPAARKLRVEIEVDGSPVALPKPEEFPPLELFSSALADIRAGDTSVEAIRSLKPAKELGSLAIRKGLCCIRTGAGARASTVIPRRSHHIALMRPVELVVRYLEGEPFQDARFEWAGVFVCSDEERVEGAFASAEPPAHDDWLPQNLPKGQEKTFVNVALNRLKERAASYAAPNPVDRGVVEGGGRSLARTAAKLGSLLGAVSGQGPGRGTGRPARPRTRKTTSISQPSFVRLTLGSDGERIALFEAELTNDGSSPGLRLVANPFLAMDGGRASSEGLPPEYETAVVRLTLGDRSTDGSSLVAGKEAGGVTVAVRCPAGAAVGVHLRVEE